MLSILILPCSLCPEMQGIEGSKFVPNYSVSGLLNLIHACLPFKPHPCMPFKHHLAQNDSCDWYIMHACIFKLFVTRKLSKLTTKLTNY